MKVVLFCGGYGMRIRDYSESTPKPMVPVGYRPILWHVMKYYAHYGHKDFILCLGWKANVIKEYFLKYDECVSNDFVLSSGGKNVSLLGSDIHDWNITFVNTGHGALIGERLKAVERHLDGEETFLANYTDGLSDVHLPSMIDFHQNHRGMATFLSVRPPQTFHTISISDEGRVTQICDARSTDVWVNGGFFVLNRGIFDYLGKGRDLMGPAMAELIDERRAYSYRHQGFWSCMDTYKEKQTLDEMYDRGNPPWEVWKHAEAHSGTPSSAETASGQGSGCQPLPVDQASTVQVAANAN